MSDTQAFGGEKPGCVSTAILVLFDEIPEVLFDSMQINVGCIGVGPIRWAFDCQSSHTMTLRKTLSGRIPGFSLGIETTAAHMLH